MLTDKQIKAQYRPIFWKKPDRYYATDVLKEEGFTRAYCTDCKKPFWSTAGQDYCGDPACGNQESFRFIGKSPAKKKLAYLDVWTQFSKQFKAFGYTPIKRYPIVARWNPTMEYTNASIAAFQPFVVSGEVEPPANPLVIPQFCFRTVDIDNVGISGAHNTVFNMIGQHQFVKPQDWNQNKAFRHIHSWLTKGLKLPNDEITYIEDSWAGGGNFGCCMEFFSRGCELGNQVYMLYEQTPTGAKELDKKVLDMGMGMERNAWFSQGTNTIYDAAFPTVIKHLLNKTRLSFDKKLIKTYVPYAGLLNIDEIDDINKAWTLVSTRTGYTIKELKDNVLPLAALYSIAEHTRSLLITLNDGGLPSNVGGGYNLRVIFRRALSFIDQYNWGIDLFELCTLHAKDLKPVFPELSTNLEDIKNILDVEQDKYNTNKLKTRNIVRQLSSKKTRITEDTLYTLYDSHGITPELLKEELGAHKKTITIPENFYSKVSELHDTAEQKHQTARALPITATNLPQTDVLYYDDYKKTSFTAKVITQQGPYVVLNKTYFYATSGGQLHDTGTIDDVPVVDIIRQGNVVVHVLGTPKKLPINKPVHCRIDWDRRLQLSQHHTAAHILNAAARTILGNHINQASAYKNVTKGRLDITHYQSLTPEEIRKIENEANNIIKKRIPVHKTFMPRNKAEQQYGMTIYQGPAVPGKELRIVNIKGIDVECCGGSHLDNTAEVERMNITKVSKISDAIVRLEYVAGNAANQHLDKEHTLLKEAATVLSINEDMVPSRAHEVFTLWKKVVKKKKRMNITFTSTHKDKGTDKELLDKTAQLLRTQPDHVPKTLKRFLHELNAKR